MELFRVTSNPYGQEAIVGLSWSLLWWFVAAGVAFIVVHAVWMAVGRSRRRATSTHGKGGVAR